MPLSELLIRISCTFFILIVLARIMGRKELRQITFFNFVSAIAIGSIGANLVVNQNLSIRNGVIALVGWAAFTVVMGLIDIHSKKARRFLEGEPIVVIKNGKIMEKALRLVRLDVDALRALLRKNGVFAVSDVAYAIFETDGYLSVMKNEDKQPATKKDVNLNFEPVVPAFMPTEVISDGKINQHNLDKLNIDKTWVEEQVQNTGLPSIKDVFYAELQKDGSLYIDQREDAEPLLH